MRTLVLLVLSGSLLPLASTASAGSLTAEQIVDKARERGGVYMMGFDEGESKVKIILQDTRGNKRVREVQSRVRRKESGDREATMRFLEPKDVRGVTVLQHENRGSEDNIYLYLPAFRRTRRIAGNDKGGQFMGTDFSYADMEDQERRDAKYELGPETEIDGVPVYTVISWPYDFSQYAKHYSKVEMYIRKDNFLAQQMKYFDKKGKFLKVYRLLDTQKIEGKEVVTKSQMWTKRTNHTTFIVVEAVDSRAKLSSAEFRPEALAN